MAIKTSTTKNQTALRTKSNFQGIDTKQSFTTVDKFLGYRNREDQTMLPPGYMIPSSQNVLIDITGRLKSRKGYTLYGAANVTLAPIHSSFDWDEHLNGTINLRAYSTNLQFDYKGTWTTIFTGLSSTVSAVNFTSFWDDVKKGNVLLFVDGSSNVYEWNGGIATFASATANTITLQGTKSWQENLFYATANKKIMLGGVEYTYTGGESTTTLTGVTPDPTAGSQVVGNLIYQSVVTTANSSITSMLSTFKNDLIANVQTQIYYGSLSSNSVYVSAINNYKSVAFTTPVRVIGEGAQVNLRAPVVAFSPQEEFMYIAAGKSQWYSTKKTVSSDNSKEIFDIVPLKTSAYQGSMSQKVTSHDRNSIIFVSNEPRLVTLGRVDNIYATPMLEDYSFPIATDMNTLNFTGAWVKYHKSFVYMGVPASNKLFILNQTDPNNVFWEAPQTGCFSGASIINGDLYLHDGSVPQTYKWLDGYNDNEHLILSRATFAYNNFGNRALSDYFNEYWVDGYISANTKLSLKLAYDLDGCATNITKLIDGTKCLGVCAYKGDSSLGKASLGKHGLGTESLVQSIDPLPPYFSTIKVMPRKDFYFLSPTFESYGVDYHWEILTFGPLVTQTMFGNNQIKES
jgi:hypothetical protein